MTTYRQRADHIIHDLKNLLSVLALAVDNLAKDKNDVASQQPNLVTVADLVQELIVRIDKLAQVVGTDSDFRPQCPSSDKSKIISLEGKFKRRQYSQASGRLP